MARWDDTDSLSSEDSFFEDYDDLRFLFGVGRRRPLRTLTLGLAGLISMESEHSGIRDRPSSSKTCQEDSEMELDVGETESSSKKTRKQVQSLLDSCSKAVARNCTCEQLENADPPLDEALLKRIAALAFPQDERQVRAYANLTDRYNDWERGLNLFRDNRIKEMWQVGFMASAHLRKYPVSTSNHHPPDDNCEIRVSLTFEQQRIISSTCSECRGEVWCPHVIASIIYRIRNLSQVPVHAPMTEALSTLDRDQLQKLLQYAVQEDPAGILGKVFKHLDDIRDSSSEINTIAGAPDPTFGRAVGSKTQWQLSIEAMEKNLKADLKEMPRYLDYTRASNSIYPNNYDLMEKKESKMFKFIRKALDLARKREMKAAANVLARIAKCVVHEMEMSQTDCPSIARLCHDLSRFFALFVLSAKPHVRTFLVKISLELQKRTAKLMSYDVEHSKWAELPSFVHLFEDKLEKDVQRGLFTEALCAGEATSWCIKLRDLLEGRVSPEESTYEEDIPLMMGRLESVNYLEQGCVSTKMGRLATRIIYKLLPVVQNDSIFGAYLKALGENSPQAKAIMKILKNGLDGVPLEVAVPADRGKTSRKRLRAAANKKTRKSPESTIGDQLTKGQLTYCMLYLCHSLILCQRKSDNKKQYERQLVGYCLLALEMSRHRTTADISDISNTESSWLLRMEVSICDYLEGVVGSSSDAVSLYIDALTTVGISFYDGCYPLVLIDSLLFLYIKIDGLRNRVDDIVTICAAFLRDSYNPLYKFTLPTSTPFDLLLDSLSGERTGQFDHHYKEYERHHKDFALKKFHTITETFLSQIDTSKRSHVTLTGKVLQQFENYENYSQLRRITKDLRFHIAKLEGESALLEGALKVLLHTLKKSQISSLMMRDTHRREDLDFIFSLVRKLGIPSLKLFIGRWQTFFHCRNLRELLMVLKPQILDCKTIPKEVIQLVMQYYSAEVMHTDSACQLLSFFKPNDTNFRQASHKILDNYKNFTVNTLFELVRLEMPNTPVPSTAKKAKLATETLTEDMYKIIEKALANLKNAPSSAINAETYNHLEWLCMQCSAGSAKEITAMNSYLSKVIGLLQEHSGRHPGVILHVLQLLEKTPTLFKMASVLGEALVNAYSQHFIDRFHDCSHAAYGNVINEMRCAQLHCKQYIKVGDALFEARVVAKVREAHSGKKKLLRMLEVMFRPKANGAGGTAPVPSGKGKV